jgi:hypothetical protein
MGWAVLLKPDTKLGKGSSKDFLSRSEGTVKNKWDRVWKAGVTIVLAWLCGQPLVSKMTSSAESRDNQTQSQQVWFSPGAKVTMGEVPHPESQTNQNENNNDNPSSQPNKIQHIDIADRWEATQSEKEYLIRQDGEFVEMFEKEPAFSRMAYGPMHGRHLSLKASSSLAFTAGRDDSEGTLELELSDDGQYLHGQFVVHGEVKQILTLRRMH